MLDVRGLTFGYGGYGGSGGSFRLAGVSFAVAPGEIFGVVGPNSAGKTTLLGLLSKVHEPEAGEVRLGGVSLVRLSRRDLARRVAVVPQDLAVAFPFTVEELCLMGRYPHGGRLFEGPQDARQAQAAMTLAGVAALAAQTIDTLAGGERQRVLLARALAQEPEVLLLDEPTSHLDLRHQRELVGLLRRLNRERGLTVVFVSHDLTLAAEMADRLLLLVGGRAVQVGTPAEVLSEAVLEPAYGCPVVVDKSPVSGRPVVHVRWE
jgi:iron complex transport system ATP-binding protein